MESQSSLGLAPPRPAQRSTEIVLAPHCLLWSLAISWEPMAFLVVHGCIPA